MQCSPPRGPVEMIRVWMLGGGGPAAAVGVPSGMIMQGATATARRAEAGQCAPDSAFQMPCSHSPGPRGWTPSDRAFKVGHAALSAWSGSMRCTTAAVQRMDEHIASSEKSSRARAGNWVWVAPP